MRQLIKQLLHFIAVATRESDSPHHDLDDATRNFFKSKRSCAGR